MQQDNPLLLGLQEELKKKNPHSVWKRVHIREKKNLGKDLALPNQSRSPPSIVFYCDL